MTRSSLLLLSLVWWAPLGCPTAEKPVETGDTAATDTDADTDADTDSDADSDTDTDADSDADTDADSDADTDTDTDTTPVVDADLDGYTDDVDCDDGDASVYPGATEIEDDGIDQDCDGADASRYTAIADLVAGDLTVTEVMQNPSAVGDSAGEWFEVANTSGVPVNLEGLIVSDLGSDSFTVSGDLLLEPGAFAVFGINGDLGTNGNVVVSYVYPSFNLGNDDDELILSNGVEDLDAISWTGADPWPDPNGASMNLDVSHIPLDDNDDGANWCAATVAWAGGDLGSPGNANEACAGDPVDDDGDGYDTTVDCNDADATINPGAADVAGDGVDQNCDGADAKSSGGTTFAPGELIITEVMNNPNAVSDASGEWFEIYVNTTGPVDLSGLVITDNGTNTFTISGLTANGGDYLLFSVNGDSATNGGLTPDYTYPSTMGLGNDDDGLTLTNADGTEVDTITWDNGATFPDPTGASMQLDTSYFDATDNDDGANWCEGTTAYGSGDYGTPGAANEACTVDSDEDGYGVDVDCNDADATVNPGATDTPDDGIDQDCDGSDATSVVPAAGPGDLIITEVMNNPSAVSDSAGEYFEVYVAADHRVALAGITISDASGNSDTISGLEADPGYYIVFVENVESANNGGVIGDWEYGTGIGLSNDSDSITLTAADGTVIDSVAWDNGATFPDPNGASMNLDDGSIDATANDDGANWCETTSSTYGLGDYGTPGAANESCDATVDADLDGYDSTVDCNDADGTINPGAAEIAGDGIDQDCDGVDASATLGVDDIATGELVITEIMQNPSSVADEAGEWFEILNTSAYTFDLDGLRVYDAGTNSFTVSGSVLVGPGEYVVFGNNGTTSTNGGVDMAYVFTASSMALGNSDDEIILANTAGIIDQVYYDGGPSFPDPSGASMSLDPSVTDATGNDDAGNWCTATVQWATGDYGSPNAANDGC